MMPKCTGGLTDCPNTAVFLGPHEQPALCAQHLGDLMDRIAHWVNRNNKAEVPPGRQQFEIKNDEIQTVLQDIGGKIGSQLPKGWGFTLAIASYGEKGSTFYISNVEREGSIKMLQELTAKLASHKEREGDAS